MSISFGSWAVSLGDPWLCDLASRRECLCREHAGKLSPPPPWLGFSASCCVSYRVGARATLALQRLLHFVSRRGDAPPRPAAGAGAGAGDGRPRTPPQAA